MTSQYSTLGGSGLALETVTNSNKKKMIVRAILIFELVEMPNV